jgi:flavin reductase (DIM6/NTAB) family NADH-FMN oxidoreductase RutF
MQKNVVYSQAVARKFPESVVFVIAKDRNGVCNPITLGWCMYTSHKPPMMAVSVGLKRYSLQVIRAAQSFVIAFPAAGMAEEALYYGTKSGREVNKLKERPLQTVQASRIDCVLLNDAVVNFECVLASEHKTGDHVIFAGEVIASHVNEDNSVRRLYTVESGHVMGAVDVRRRD